MVHVPGDELVPGDWACELNGAAACRGVHSRHSDVEKVR